VKPALADNLAARGGATDLLTTRIHQGEACDVVAVPTIIVEKSGTLVGMGDTAWTRGAQHGCAHGIAFPVCYDPP
jgi:hypothetical protein